MMLLPTRVSCPPQNRFQFLVHKQLNSTHCHMCPSSLARNSLKGGSTSKRTPKVSQKIKRMLPYFNQGSSLKWLSPGTSVRWPQVPSPGSIIKFGLERVYQDQCQPPASSQGPVQEVGPPAAVEHFRNPANSPVEVGSLSHDLQGFLISQVVQEFFHQQYQTQGLGFWEIPCSFCCSLFCFIHELVAGSGQKSRRVVFIYDLQ